ncbi:Uncharacterised protein [Myroides odoratus]|nr:hypothetical protein Myrod_2030 [Myroides odoratus DSM 2801]EKB07439.1 hypothetical protein HMPREF9716_01889 [Myroides odoratus CIP 103059]STZ30126.1 Uncharacterised protein [Myroides odoratus]
MKYFGVRKKEKRSNLLRFLSYYPVYGTGFISNPKYLVDQF